jgi:hypothetical protein
MKIHLIILAAIATSCKAQQNMSLVNAVDSIEYYSKECEQSINYTREYLNDSVFIEKHGNVIDTLMFTGSSLFLLHRNMRYKIIDIVNDFDKTKKHYNYYYRDLSNTDTLKSANESEVQHELRLQQSIVTYLPVEMKPVKNKQVYTYYILGNCYPIRENCIKAKIANGQYSIVYFEKDIGYTGRSTAGAKCSYQIVDKSYTALLNKKKTGVAH